MRCAACNQPIDPARADDGGLLRCACGAQIELDERRRARPPAVVEAPSAPAVSEGDPYRSPSTGDAASRAAVPLDLASFRREQGEELRCPRCAHPLRALENEAACQGCNGCGGIFVDGAALRRGREELRGVVEPGASSASPDVGPFVRCPVCREVMARTVLGRRSGVVVDACSVHGTWFDHGELVRALELVERGGFEAEPPSEGDEDDAKDPDVRRAAAQLDVSLIAEQARDAEQIGRWQGRLVMRKRSLVEALLDLLD